MSESGMPRLEVKRSAIRFLCLSSPDLIISKVFFGCETPKLFFWILVPGMQASGWGSGLLRPDARQARGRPLTRLASWSQPVERLNVR